MGNILKLIGGQIAGFIGAYKVYLIIAALLAVIAGTAFWYYKDTQHRIEVLTQEKAQLEISVDLQQKAIESLKSDMLAMGRILTDTNKKFDIARQEAQTLADKLAKHELGALAVQKPGLVQNRVNEATKEAYRCIEIQSGSPLTKEELAATKPSQINNSCPALANPNYKPKP